MAKRIKERNSRAAVIALPNEVKLTAESKAQWSRLVAGLPLERGPRLLFVILDSPLIRQHLASHLAESLGNFGTKVDIVELHEPFAQPLEHILSHVEENPIERAHFVLGLEKSLVSIEHSAAAIADLNFHRDRIPQATRVPLVFWLDSWTFKMLALRAPDFMAWRASEFHLVEDEGPISEALDRYRRHVIDRLSKLTLYSVTSDKPLAFDLEQVFVKLKASEPKTSQFGETDLRNPDFSHGSIEGISVGELSRGMDEYLDDLFQDSARFRAVRFAEETISLGEALSRHDKLAIIGAPGAGKTTLLKYLALSFARRQAKERLGVDEDRIPVYVELRDFNSFLDRAHVDAFSLPAYYSLQLFYGYLAQFHRTSFPHLGLGTNFFDLALERSKCIVLLDGLDEIADSRKRSRAAELIAHCAAGLAGNRFVLTSRPRGYETAGRPSLYSSFAECRIRDLDDEQIRTYVKSWYLAVTLDREGDSPTARDEASRRADELLGALKNDRVRPLATNPLLLSILALIHQRGRQLPQRRVALYEECVEFLLGFWDQVKGGDAARELTRVAGFTRTEKRALLEPIALWLHERGESATEVSYKDLKGRLAEEIHHLYSDNEAEATQRAARFVETVIEQAGLMVERETGVFAFAHLTFQEFLAARALADQRDCLVLVRRQLHDPWWREVILLLVGHVSSPCTRRSRDETAVVLNGIQHANSPLEDVLHRDMLLAFRCLCDVEQLGVDDALRRSMATQVFDLWRAPEIEDMRSDLREVFRYAAPTPVGPILVNLLLEVIEDTSSPSRLAAAVALGELGVGATHERVLARLTQLTKDADEDMRIVASRALGMQLDTLPPRNIVSLLRELGADAAVVRGRAAIALASSVDALSASEIIARLLELSRDSEAYVRLQTVYALDRLGEAAATAQVLARLLELSRDTDDLVRGRVAWTIGRLGNAAASAEVVPRLRALIRDASADVCEMAAQALERLGATAALREVISSMLQSTRDPQPEARASTATAIGRLGRFASTRGAVSRMLEMSHDADPSVRYAATSTLGSLASSGVTKIVVSRLLELSRDIDARVRFAAANSLGRLDGEGVKKQAMDRLLELIRDPAPIVRSAAAHAFERLGGSATADLVTRLLELIQDSSTDVRGTVLSVLETLRRPVATPQVISRLIELTRERDADVRASAAYALGVLDTATNTKEVLSRLLELIVDTDGNVREGAAAALGRLGLGEAPSELLAQTLDLMKSSDISVRANVACAVGQAAARLKPHELSELLDFWRECLVANIEGLFGGTHSRLSSVAYEQLKQLAPFVVSSKLDRKSGINQDSHDGNPISDGSAITAKGNRAKQRRK